MVKDSDLNKAIFFKSSLVFEGKKQRFLHVIPNITTMPTSINYEIYGTDDTSIEQSLECKKGNSIIISFGARLGDTYFIKMKLHYHNNSKELILFYKMEDDFEEDDEEEEEEEEETEKKENQELVVETVDVDEDERNKITQYLLDRTPQSGLELDDPDLDFSTM